MPNKVVYRSNGASVGDGMRITRVSENGQKLEVMVDNKTERFSEIVIEATPDAEEPTNPEEPPVDPVDPPTDPVDPPVDPVDPPHEHEEPHEPPVAVDPVAFTAAYVSAPDTHSHGTGTLATEHMDVMNLVRKSEATKIAVKSGNWSDPTIWHPIGVPAANDRVAIPGTIMVHYEDVIDTSIRNLRIDGVLHFDSVKSSRLVVDTIVVAPSGKFIAGSAAQPVTGKVEVLITGNGDISTSYDPKLLSRGVVSHGEVSIYGQPKTPFVKVEDALATSTVLTLKSPVTNWNVGDKLVLTGTHKEGWYYDSVLKRVSHHKSQDEELTIVAINGNQVTINKPLAFSHDAPTGYSAYLANMTRTVTFRGLVTTPVHRRGHTMFMHSNKVKVFYAAFDDLGRTDKSAPAADVGTFNPITSTSNIKGRYSVHLHKTGTVDQANPAKVVGCTVNNSPGWGFAHHSSHADFVGCVATNVFGAAFAAEDGDETGVWQNNLAINSVGVGSGDYRVKDEADKARHDNGRTGDGYFFAGRLVKAANNVAANTTNGFVWFHRSAPTDPLAANLDHPEIAYGKDKLPVDKPQIQGFLHNEAFCCYTGIIVIKANPNQGHDVRSVFKGFDAWEVVEGTHITYTAHYTFIDFNIKGKRNGRGDVGFIVGRNALDIVVVNLKADNFRDGAKGDEGFTFTIADGDYERVFVDPVFTNCGTNFVGFTSSRFKTLAASQITPGRLSFQRTSPSVWSLESDLLIDGIKTDSLGARSRSIAQDKVLLHRHNDMIPYLQNVGYWLRGNTVVLLIDDLVADRVTGDLLPLVHEVALSNTVSQLKSNWGLNNMGSKTGAKFLGNL